MDAVSLHGLGLGGLSVDFFGEALKFSGLGNLLRFCLTGLGDLSVDFLGESLESVGLGDLLVLRLTGLGDLCDLSVNLFAETLKFAGLGDLLGLRLTASRFSGVIFSFLICLPKHCPSKVSVDAEFLK